MEPLVEGAQQVLVEQLRAVHRLTAVLHACVDAGEFYEQVLDTIVTTLGVERASLLLFEPDGVMRFKAWRGLSDAYRTVVEGHSPWVAGQRQAAPILVPDVEADPELTGLLPVLRAEGIAAVAFLPLVTGAGVIGKFMLYYGHPHAFPAEQVALAEILAGHVGLAAERQQAHQRLVATAAAAQEAAAAAQAAVARLDSLQTITAELSRAVDTDAVAGVALGVALAELGARSGSLCLLEGEQLRIAAAAGYPDRVLSHWERFPLAADVPASEVVRTGEAVFWSDPDQLLARYPVFAGRPLVGEQACGVLPLGEEIPLGALVIGFAEPREFDAEDRAFMTALAGQCAAALGRAALYEQREAALRAAQASRERLAFLAEAGAVLGARLDPARTAERLAELAVPRLAEAAVVHVVEEQQLRLAAVAHVDPEGAEQVRLVLSAHPVRLSDPDGIGEVLRSGQTVVHRRGGDPGAPSGAIRACLEELGLGSAAVVALSAQGHPIGTLSLLTAAGGLDGDAVSLAEQLAGRAGAAIHTGRLFAARTAAARTLQASLLPLDLPAIDGLDLGARYLAGGAGLDVGGDFYDVFPLYGNRYLVVLGDVCGRGVEAAGTALLIRHVIRSAALTLRAPAAILGHVNDVMIRQDEPGDPGTGTGVPPAEPRFATAVLAVVHPRHDATVAVTLAVAGHPLPMLRRADASVTPAGVPGSLLGVDPDPMLADQTVLLRGGDALVCFTDGVTERRDGPVFFGEDGLRRLLGRADADVGADALAGLVQRAVTAFAADDPEDDLAVLVLRAPRGGRAAR